MCRNATNEYKKYSFSYSKEEERVFLSLKKFGKTLEELGEDDEAFSQCMPKFWAKNREYFLRGKRERWHENTVSLHIYNSEGKIIKGPSLYLSEIYRMAGQVDKKRPKSSKDDGYAPRLQKALFTLLSQSCDEFKVSPVTTSPPVPFDFSRVGDIINNIIDSGIVPGSENADKEELMNIVNGFVKNPKIGEIFGAVTQMVANENVVSPDTLKEIVADVKKD